MSAENEKIIEVGRWYINGKPARHGVTIAQLSEALRKGIANQYIENNLDRSEAPESELKQYLKETDLEPGVLYYYGAKTKPGTTPAKLAETEKNGTLDEYLEAGSLTRV